MTTNTEAVKPQTTPSTVAERMRLYRKRRHRGNRCVRIQLHRTDIEALVRKGYLKPELRNDTGEIQGAVAAFFDDSLNEYGCT